MAMNLAVIAASTRPGRIGIHLAEWITGVAAAHPAFETRLVDLREVGLPVYDEPKHPRLRDYQNAHTRRWSEIVDASDAFVLVTPEYNHSPAPSMLNALDYLFQEWAWKPAGFVSYGGISGGLRGVQGLKPALAALSIVPIVEGVVAPFAANQISGGVFTPNETQAKAAPAMLDELARVATALKPLRNRD